MNKIFTILNRTRLMVIGVVAIAFLGMGLAMALPASAQTGGDTPVRSGAPAPATPEELEDGKSVYFKRCVWCHGVEGAGDGPGADRLWPRPRDFTQGTFKIRSTKSGELPLEDDLFLTVTHGLPGSAMPPWKGILSEQERRNVVKFVMTELVLDRDFQDDPENEEFLMLDDGPQIASSEESIARGLEVYRSKGKCVECHGEEGRGDGNKTQKDEWGFPIFPAQLTKCWNFRGSRADPYNPRNVFREVSTGLNGTPMPSFEDTLTVEQRWDVANFVISLCPKRKIDPLTDHPTMNFVIKSSFIEGEIPSDPQDEVWQNIELQYIGLAGQIMHKPRNFVRLVDDVWVKSIFNGEEIAWAFEWDDRTQSLATPEALAQVASFLETPPSGEPIALRQYPVFNDAVGIQFPAKWQELSPPEKPRFVFGDAKRAVDVWKWEADGTVKGYVGHGSMKGELKLEAHPKNTLKTIHAEFKNGRWRVIIKRAMTTDDAENDVQFEMGQYIPTVFFVWDGHNGDHGLKSSISTWYYTILEPPIPTKAYIFPFLAIIVVFGIEGWIIRKVNENKKQS